MKILVTGAKGFVGKNLVENLKLIRDGKNQQRLNLNISEILEYSHDMSDFYLERFCREADFVFNFAGVNRPQDDSEYMTGNYGFTSKLLKTLVDNNNSCPIMYASSIQAAMDGDFASSKYGYSKREAEKIVIDYSRKNNCRVFIYRFPNIFGKWCKPNYNSVVATFCNAIANDQPYVVDDYGKEIELLYIDDLIEEMIDVLEGKEHHCVYPFLDTHDTCDGSEVITSSETVCERYCYVPFTYKATLGRIIEILKSFSLQPETLMFERVASDGLEKKLYSTYLSYLPENKTFFELDLKADHRGFFSEFFKSTGTGQFSVNVSKPGMTKGEHWHNSKVEIFLVVSGQGVIKERRLGTDETGQVYPVREYKVSGEKLQCVYILPGYIHSIVNLSESEDLVTIMWSNEIFSEDHTDTYRAYVNCLESSDQPIQ